MGQHNTSPEYLRRLYDRGANVMAYLREALGASDNTQEIIAIAYDLQAGSYIGALKDLKHKQQIDQYTRAVGRVLSSLHCSSLLEAGVGEATTLCGVLTGLQQSPRHAFGFDFSWSRTAFARGYAQSLGFSSVRVFVGTLMSIPLADGSFDVVYTSHSIEPNRGQEEAIIRELYRVAQRYVVLFEPIFELANDKAQARMEEHGYCRNLYQTAKNLGLNVIEYRLFDYSVNPLNPTGIIVIEKKRPAAESAKPRYQCPVSKSPLRLIGEHYFSQSSFLVYPVILGIPCLLPNNGILASRYEEMAGAKWVTSSQNQSSSIP